MTLYELNDELKAICDIKYRNALKDRHITDIRFIQKNLESYDESTIYMAEDTSLVQSLPKGSCILIREGKGGLTDSALKDMDIIYYSGSPPLHVYLGARNILYEDLLLESRISALYELSVKNAGLEKIIDASAELLGNPFLIYDKTFKLYGASKMFRIDDPVWKEHIHAGQPSAHFIKQALRSSSHPVNRTDDPMVAYMGSCKRSHFPWLFCDIMQDSAVVGYVLMFSSQTPINARHYKILPHVRDIVKAELVKLGAFKVTYSSLQQKLMAELLEATPEEDLQHIRMRYETLNIRFSEDSYVVVFEPSSPEIKKVLPNIVRSLLKDKFEQFYHLGYENHCVAVIRPESVKFSEEEIQFLSQIASEQKWVIGISNRFSEISEFRECYRQALHAIRLSGELGTAACVNQYYTYAFDDMLSLLNKKDSLLRYTHPAVMKLLQADKANNSELYHTLNVFVSTGKSSVETAKLLHLHRNSLAYRMRSINEHTGLDLDDNNTIFSLQYSFRIFRHLGLDRELTEAAD